MWMRIHNLMYQFAGWQSESNDSVFRLKEEKAKVNTNYKQLRQQFQELEENHHQLVTNNYRKRKSKSHLFHSNGHNQRKAQSWEWFHRGWYYFLFLFRLFHQQILHKLQSNISSSLAPTSCMSSFHLKFSAVPLFWWRPSLGPCFSIILHDSLLSRGN